MRRLISFGLALGWAPAWAADGVQYATPLWVWICAGAAITVFGAIAHSVATYRPTSADASMSQRRAARELVWASIPIVIVIAAAMPSLIHTSPRDQLAANRGVPPEICLEGAKTLRPNPISGSVSELRKVSATSCTTQQ